MFRQGDSLSPTLFADDAVIYLNNNLFHFECVFTILDTFGSEVGCEVNFNKARASYGGKRKTKIKPYLDKGLVRPATYIELYINLPLIQYNLSLFKHNFDTTITK